MKKKKKTTTRSGKAKAKVKVKVKVKAKAKRKPSSVKDLSAKTAATVRGGLPAVQKVQASPTTQAWVPSESITMNYSKMER